MLRQLQQRVAGALAHKALAEDGRQLVQEKVGEDNAARNGWHIVIVAREQGYRERGDGNVVDRLCELLVGRVEHELQDCVHALRSTSERESGSESGRQSDASLHCKLQAE